MGDVRLSSPDKVLWPATGHTKRDLWDHVHAVADRLLPHLADRPLSVKRFPRGVGAKGFFQKNLPDHAPDTIGRWREWAASSGREVAYGLVDDVDGLAWFAQQNTIEFHPAMVRVDRPDRPDRLVIDLDAGERELPVARAARWVREVLVELGLDPLVTTTGGRGLHVVVVIERRYDMGLLRPLTLAIARMVADRHPDELTFEMRKEGREGRLFLDWSRSSPSATLIAPWSARGRELPTVATPLHWDEVTDDLDPTAFTIDTIGDRDDPWANAAGPARLESVVAGVEAAGYDLVDASPRGTTANYLKS